MHSLQNQVSAHDRYDVDQVVWRRNEAAGLTLSGSALHKRQQLNDNFRTRVALFLWHDKQNVKATACKNVRLTEIRLNKTETILKQKFQNCFA